jgi:hypothetical protein
MGNTGARRIRRQEAERLLSGVLTAADRHELLRLLRLAAAPTRPGELAGREVAVASMVSVYDRTPERPSYLSVLSRAVAVKVAAAIAVLLLGGTAVAAGTGSLPPPVQHGIFTVIGDPVPDAPSPTPHGAHWPPGHGTSPDPTATPDGRPTTVAPPPNAGGLCHAWEAQRDRTPDPALVRELSPLAGGEQKIPAFCAAILTESNPRASPSQTKSHPTPAAPTPSHQPNGKRPSAGTSHGPP